MDMNTLYKKCFDEMFLESYKESQDYLKSLADMSTYLLSEDDSFDYMFNSHNIKKEDFNLWLFYNFLVINFYRVKSNVLIDDMRMGFVNAIKRSEKEPHFVDALVFDIVQFSMVINDVLLLFHHASPTYHQNAVRSFYSDDITKKLYQNCPIVAVDDLNALINNFSDKENLLYLLEEILAHSTEKVIFSKGNIPIPDGYKQGIVEYLKKNSNKILLNREILKEFNKRLKLTENVDYNKVLTIEMFLSMMYEKWDHNVLPAPYEEKLVHDLECEDCKSAESVVKFYDNNDFKIMFSLINSGYIFMDDTSFFNKSSEFREIQKQYKKKI